MRTKYILPLLLLVITTSYGQDNISESQKKATPVNIFPSSRILAGRTAVTNQKRVLEFVISHRFGPLNTGLYNFYGMDNAVIRLGLEYALTDRIAIGLGRSSLRKTYDGYAVVNILEQTKGAKVTPLSATFLSSVAYETVRTTPEKSFREKILYSYQFLLARKFGEVFSLQLTPTLVHRNVVQEGQDNDIYGIGISASVPVSKRINILGEYYYIANPQENMEAPIAAGLEIHTWGHYFQLLFTNSRGMIPSSYFTQTEQGIFDGGLGFGFNIGRRFHIRKKR